MQPDGGWSSRNPHFLFFLAKKKRKRAFHGPKEKKTTGVYGGAAEAWEEDRQAKARAIGAGGGFGGRGKDLTSCPACALMP